MAAFDVVAPDQDALASTMRELTRRGRDLSGAFSPDAGDPLFPPSESGITGSTTGPADLTMTVSVGSSLFDDRYGLAGRMPKQLRRHAGLSQRRARPGAVARRRDGPGLHGRPGLGHPRPALSPDGRPRRAAAALADGGVRPTRREADPRSHHDAQPARLQGRDGEPRRHRGPAHGRARLGRRGGRRALLGGRGVVCRRPHHPDVRRALGPHRIVRAGGDHRPDQADRGADGPRSRRGRARTTRPTRRARRSRSLPTSGWPIREPRRRRAAASCDAAIRSRAASTRPGCSTRGCCSSPTSATWTPGS